LNFLFFDFFFALSARFWEGKKRWEGREKEMEVTVTAVRSWIWIWEILRRPSPESTSGIEIDGDSAPKKSRVIRHVFTRLEKEILVNLYNTNKLKDKRDIHDVVLLLSKDDRPLSETQVKTSVDNYKSSLNRKKQSEKDRD
jgi:hypothetical protein